MMLLVLVYVPVVLCTGYSPNVTAEDRARLGVSALIRKPYTFEQLAEAVARYIRLPAGSLPPPSRASIPQR